MQIPKGFIDNALEEVRTEMLGHLRSGAILDADYYASIAAARVWYCFLNWKNSESDRDECLRLRDIMSGCHRRGIPCRMDTCDLHITMPGHEFMFSDAHPGGGIYGGPCDRNGDYQGYSLLECPVLITSRTFFRLLVQVDSVIDALHAPVAEHMKRVCLQYRTSELAETTIQVLFEPGMEDLSYRYRINSDNDGDSVDVWLFYNRKVPKDYRSLCVHFHFTLDDFMERMELFKKILHIVAKDITRWESYSICFRVETLWERSCNVPERPKRGFPKIVQG